ncbi:hypothetical protein [Angustibacter peucedani]
MLGPCPRPPDPIGAPSMGDLLLVVVVLASFALAAAFLKGVERL